MAPESHITIATPNIVRPPKRSEKAQYSAAKLALRLRRAIPEYWSDFHAKWDAWQEAIDPSSKPAKWASVPEFAALAALGPKAVPLVLWQLLQDKDDPTAVFLYNKLEHDPSFIVHDAPIAVQVTTILENNRRRTRAVRNVLLDWVNIFSKGLPVCRAKDPTNLEEVFQRLMKIGPPVVPQLMLRYDKYRDSCPYELLHGAMWGYMAKRRLVDQWPIWKEWFEGKEYAEAPHYPRPE